MKKFLLTITAAALTTLAVNAQVDYGFETWVDVANAAPGTQDPKGWASFNVLTAVSMPPTVIKETASPAVGSAAAKIVTQPIPAIVTIPGYDTVGLLAIGSINLLTKSINLGTAYTSRSAKVTFSTKYQPASLDTASVYVALTKYNTTTKKIDTVAKGLWNSSATVTAWTAQTIDLNYNPNFSNVAPDSIKIIASSSSFYRPKVGSTLYIDDINMSGWVSTNDLEGIKNNVIVYPTPAKANISFTSSVNAKSVEILDIAGRNVGVFQMTSNKVTVETAKFESGMYIYNVLNDQSQVVGRGKFEVVK